MQKISFNQSWQVMPRIPGSLDALFPPPDVHKKPVNVTLPHDAMIEEERDPDSPSNGQYGYYPAKLYTYLKTFQAPEEWRNRHILLEFEGVMRRAMVYLNGEFLISHTNGYTGFFVDLDHYLRYGQENTLKVIAVNDEKSSRWYPGSGIYRDVWLHLGGSAWFVPEKQRITTLSIEESYAVLRLEGLAVNAGKQTRELTLEAGIFAPDGSPAARTICRLPLTPGEDGQWHTQVTVDRPSLWSDESPDLYTCQLRLLEGTEVLDQWEDSFGIRTLSLDARSGLRINGKEVKLRGACIHHDNGLIGATTLPDAELFRMKNLKAAGFNAIRSAHNPASKALLYACDRIGMLVMDELSDMWNEPKCCNDWATDFNAQWEQELESMVDKDYNHPSVIMFSTGNEIPEIGRLSGQIINRRIAEAMHRMDSTRYSTFGLNGLLAVSDVMDMSTFGKSATKQDESDEGSEKLNKLMGDIPTQANDRFSISDTLTDRVEAAASAVDIVGYNYLTARHLLEHVLHPDRIVVGSETFPVEIARLWKIVEENHHVIGDFTWTGYDYLGEAGIGIPHYISADQGAQGGYPDRLAYCGDIDLNGTRRPVNYLREIAYGLSRGPYIAVERVDRYGQRFDTNKWKYADCLASWTFPGLEGNPARVRVLADCQEVELLLDGKTLGREKVGSQEVLTAIFETVYRPGELTAVGYDDGQEIGRCSLRTAGEVAGIRLAADREVMPADGRSLAFVTGDLVDREGLWNRWDAKEVTVQIEGPGILLGFGSAAPSTEGSYKSTTCCTWDGRVMAVIHSTEEPGDISVRFSAEGCSDATLVLHAES